MVHKPVPSGLYCAALTGGSRGGRQVVGLSVFSCRRKDDTGKGCGEKRPNGGEQGYDRLT